MKKDRISAAVISRLPRYYRFLKENLAAGVIKISSNAISNKLGITASQVRQDFSNFGEFGQQGYGYDVEYLTKQIREILGLTKSHNVIIVGGGKIGLAILNYTTFQKEGFVFIGIFDKAVNVDDSITVPKFKTSELSEFCKNNIVDIAVLSVPREVAQDAADMIKDCGITAIWNFAPIDLDCAGVTVQNIHMSESLYTLTYKLEHKDSL